MAAGQHPVARIIVVLDRVERAAKQKKKEKKTKNTKHKLRLSEGRHQPPTPASTHTCMRVCVCGVTGMGGNVVRLTCIKSRSHIMWQLLAGDILSSLGSVGERVFHRSFRSIENSATTGLPHHATSRRLASSSIPCYVPRTASSPHILLPSTNCHLLTSSCIPHPHGRSQRCLHTSRACLPLPSLFPHPTPSTRCSLGSTCSCGYHRYL